MSKIEAEIRVVTNTAHPIAGGIETDVQIVKASDIGYWLFNNPIEREYQSRHYDIHIKPQTKEIDE